MTRRALMPIVGWVTVTLVAAACGGEEPVPIDLNATSTTVTADEPSAGDPNAAARAQAIALAEQQCLEDPDLDEGIIQIAVPETGEVVAEVVADCAEVRSRES